MQKKTDFSFAFPSASNFGGAKVTKSRAKYKRYVQKSIPFLLNYQIIPYICISKQQEPTTISLRRI